MRRLLAASCFIVASVLVRAGTLEDMDLRSNFETSVRGKASTANLHLRIQVENGVARPEGIVHDLNQADDVAELAAKIKGITGVDRSRLRLEFTADGDEAIAASVARVLFELPKYSASSIKVAVQKGVVTLTGAIKSAAWRGEIRRLCGAVQGVMDVIDRIETPATPDSKIQKVLDGVFGPRVVPRFPGRVRAVVTDGVVTLEGRVPRLYDKQAAEHDARGINGVHRVDNLLELGSGTEIKVIHP